MIVPSSTAVTVLLWLVGWTFTCGKRHARTSALKPRSVDRHCESLNQDLGTLAPGGELQPDAISQKVDDDLLRTCMLVISHVIPCYHWHESEVADCETMILMPIST